MKISEKMLEDWICKHPDCLKNIVIIGRQIELKHGILDLLGFDYLIRKVVIIELKACELQEKDVGQLLRYKHDVDSLLVYYADTMIDNMADVPPEISSFDFHVFPILIGNSVNQKVLASMVGGGGVCFVWSYDEQSHRIVINLPDSEIVDDTLSFDESYPEWLRIALSIQFQYLIYEGYQRKDSAPRDG